MAFRLPWWALLCIGAFTLPLCLIFDHLGKLELTIPTLMSAFVLGLIIFVKWRLRLKIWFWVSMAVFLALHIWLLVSVPWTKKWMPAATTAGIGTIDVYAMLYVISTVGRLRGSKEV